MMRIVRRKSIALLLTFSIMALYTNLLAYEKRGSQLVVEKLDRRRVFGELIAVRGHSLLLLSDGGDVSINLHEVKAIKIGRKSKTWLGAAIGFSLGTGYAIYDLSDEGALLRGYVIWPLVAGGALALVGAGLGSMFGVDKSIQIEGKTEKETKQILEDLRKKARVPDFQ
jgi:hypothetical protein